MAIALKTRPPLTRHPRNTPTGPVAIDWNHPLTRGLVAYWFPAHNGLRSLVPGIADATPVNSGILQRGPLGQGYGLATAAVGGYATTPHNTAWKPTTAITIVHCGWMIGTGTTGYAGSTENSNDGWGIYNYGSTTPHIYIRMSDGGGSWYDNSATVNNVNLPTQIAVTYDGANVLYHSDVASYGFAATGTIVQSTNPLVFGGDIIGNSGSASGVQYFGIWNRALSANELQYLKLNPWIFLKQSNDNLQLTTDVAGNTIGTPASTGNTSTVAAAGITAGRMTGSATGTSTVSASTQATAIASGSATGTSTVSANAIRAGVGAGSATGNSAVSAVGAQQGIASGSATGTSTVSAVGIGAIQANATAIGASTVSGTTSTLFTASGSATGASAVNGSAAAVIRATAATTGNTSSVSASSTQANVATASAAGSSGVAGTGQSNAIASGTATGQSTVTAVGAGNGAAGATATGTSTVSAVGQSLRQATGSATGASTVSGQGAFQSVGSSTATATGASTVSAVGRAVKVATASATGQSTVSAGTLHGVSATATGQSTVSAVGAAVTLAQAYAVGSSNTQAHSIQGNSPALANATGHSEVVAHGRYKLGNRRPVIIWGTP